jgi:hypothetical protein
MLAFKKPVKAESAPKTATSIQTYVATTNSAILDGNGSPLYQTGEIIQLVGTYDDNGVYTEQYVVLKPNVDNVVLLDSQFVRSNFIIDGASQGSTSVTRDRISWTPVTFGAVPKTVAELLQDAGTILSVNTVQVILAIDGAKSNEADYLKHAPSGDVLLDGVGLAAGSELVMSTPNEIATEKFVAVPEVANSTIAGFISVYNSKN